MMTRNRGSSNMQEHVAVFHNPSYTQAIDIWHEGLRYLDKDGIKKLANMLKC